MAAHKHAIIIAVILSIAAVFTAACGSDAKSTVSSSSASQQSIDELTARVQRDEMLNAWVTVSNLPLHDFDAELQGGKIDGKYVPALRTLIRVLALTDWSNDLKEFTMRMHDEAVALFRGLNAGEEASALKDRSAALHVDADAFGSTVGNVIGKGLPADAGGPGPTRASTSPSGTTITPTPHP
jgi:hypothetical protein